MAVLESSDYRAARERLKGNPVIAMMAAGVVTVPLAGLAGEDGTPPSHLMNRANRAFDDAEAGNAGKPRLPAVPEGCAPAPRADRRGRPRRARGDARDAARRSALDEAIAPLLELAAPLRTGAQRDALAPYVIRKITEHRRP